MMKINQRNTIHFIFIISISITFLKELELVLSTKAPVCLNVENAKY